MIARPNTRPQFSACAIGIGYAELFATRIANHNMRIAHERGGCYEYEEVDRTPPRVLSRSPGCCTFTFRSMGWMTYRAAAH